MKIKSALYLILTLIICRADADDITDYVTTSTQEVVNTKKKLSSKDGIFNDVNYKGTLIRQARPDERMPASAELSAGSN